MTCRVPLDRPAVLRDLTDAQVRADIRNQAVADAHKTANRRNRTSTPTCGNGT